MVRIDVSSEAAKLPVKATMLYYTVSYVENYQVNPIIYEKTLSLINSYRKSMDLGSIKKHHMIRVYRDYLWSLGIDPTKIRPSHEALLRRCIRTGSLPSINAVVDIGNYASLKYLVPVGLYDLQKIKPPLTIRLSIDGEPFYPIGSDTAKILPRGIPLLSDSEKPIHIFPSRDSKFTKVDLKTDKLLVIVAGVEGVPETTLEETASEIASYLREYCRAEGISNFAKVSFGGGGES